MKLVPECFTNWQTMEKSIYKNNKTKKSIIDKKFKYIFARKNESIRSILLLDKEISSTFLYYCIDINGNHVFPAIDENNVLKEKYYIEECEIPTLEFFIECLEEDDIIHIHDYEKKIYLDSEDEDNSNTKEIIYNLLEEEKIYNDLKVYMFE